MKQRIPLTDYNKEILIKIHGMKPEELIHQFWINKIMNDPELLLPLLNNRFGAKDPQRRIMIKARRMMMKHIYQTLNLPGRSGSNAKQKLWFKLVKQAGLKVTE